MTRIASRVWVVLIFAGLLVGGFIFFTVEFSMDSDTWVVQQGSPHVYNGENINIGVVTDSDNTLLLDMRDGRRYSSDVTLNKTTIHWLGDRYGMISAPALPYYAEELIGYDLLSGVYAYGDATGCAELTFSAQVQKAALEAMGNYNGTVAVYNYETGQILCAVTTPGYDPDNVPENITDPAAYSAPYWNRFTQAVYIPGSIFKTVTLAAALENDPQLLEKTYTCTGRYQFSGEADVLTCEAAHGTQDVKTAFRNSCNCVFAQIALELGGQTLEQYTEKFGINREVFFDGIRTASGTYDPGNADIFLARSAIGQHNDQINPCSFMTYMGAIARDGVGVEPYLVERVSVGSDVTYEAETQVRKRIMSQETARLMQEFMRNNVADKYGDWNFPGLNVCAKTGTAEVVNVQEGETATVKPNAMFTGFVEDPEYPLAFIVCVEDGGYGSTVCIPIAARVLAACKDHMDQN